MKVEVGRPLIEIIKMCYAANLSALLEGPHGVGKSAVLEEAARELEIDFITRDLSLMEPPDLVGIPQIAAGKTWYCPPSFLPAKGRGLLVLEELNRAPRYMRSPCMQLLTARSLNDYVLPEGWVPMAAINPATANYEVDELDSALLSRFVRIEVEADPERWLEWARGSGVHHAVLAYVASDPSIFKSPENNPRAWEYVSRAVHAAGQHTAPNDALEAIVAGLVGTKRAAAFLKTIRDGEQPLTAGQILAYALHGKRLQDWIRQDRIDLVRGSLLNVLKHLQVRDHYKDARSKPKVWASLGSFLRDLPGDLRDEAVAFFKEYEYDVPVHKKRRSA